MPKDIHVSVVIPIFNEQERIAGSLTKIIRFFSGKDYDWELVCVLDGCTDASADVIRDVCRREKAGMRRCFFSLIENTMNFGKGHGVRQGVMASEGRYVLFTDADLSTPIEEIDKLLAYCGRGHNIAIGSRSIDGANVEIRQNVLRQTMGKSFNFLVRSLTGLSYHDTQCGFKCFDRKAVNEIFHRLKINGFSFDVEILYLAQRHGLTVKEVPIRWLNSPNSKVNMISDSIKMFLSLFTIVRLHAR